MAAGQAASSTGGRSDKLRLLCLHGYLQNGDVFRMRIGSMRKALKSRLEFVFLDAPFEVAAEELPAGTQQAAEASGALRGGRSWFRWDVHEGPSTRPSRAVTYKEWEVAYQGLCRALVEHRPDGLLGFSQGGAATALLLAELITAQREGRDTHVPRPRFAVVVAGFLPRDPRYASLIRDARVDTPTLFVAGQTDQLIPPDRIEELARTFLPASTQLYEHPGAHMVPTCTGEWKQVLCSFLDGVRPRAAGSDDVGPGGT